MVDRDPVERDFIALRLFHDTRRRGLRMAEDAERRGVRGELPPGTQRVAKARVLETEGPPAGRARIRSANFSGQGTD